MPTVIQVIARMADGNHVGYLMVGKGVTLSGNFVDSDCKGEELHATGIALEGQTTGTIRRRR